MGRTDFKPVCQCEHWQVCPACKPDFFDAHGNMKPIKKAGALPWGLDGLMAVAAFRYCCGRRTYIVRMCADWIIAQWKNFPANVRALIQRDLEWEFQRDDEHRANGCDHRPLGDDCDRKEWERVRALWRAA